MQTNEFRTGKELRLVYYDYKMKLDDDNKQYGIKFDVSLDTLINEIWIAPQADDWYVELIKNEMKIHNLNKPIIPSHI